MKTAHTPGPWHINDGFEISGTIIASGGHESRKVCTVWTDWRNGVDNIPIETKKANAQLIASAPELLEALQAAFHYLEAHRPKGKIREIFSELNEYENAVMKPARAAIAKATGAEK